VILRPEPTEEDWLRELYGDPPAPEPEPPQLGPGAANRPASDVDDVRPPYRVLNDVDAFRWLLDELGTRGLSGIFLRGQTVVLTHRVGEEGYLEPRDDRDCNGPATIRPADASAVIARLALHYDIHAVSKTGEPYERFFPAQAAKLALEALDRAPNLRILRGVTHTPMVRTDGTILDRPGFDDASGFLLLPEVTVPPVPARPTGAQVADAVTLLRGMVADFVWAGDHDEVNFLGLLLTPLLRELCPPPYKLGAIMARQPGSGKSLLNSILRTVHGGVFRSEMPHDDAEMSKVLTSILTCTTAPVVQFDNVSGTLRSSRLAGLLTSDVYSDRVLGSTNSVDMPNDRLWTITGNNLNLGGDLVRRTLWVTIDPKIPNPHLRTGFRIANLPGWVADHRPEILHALLTLVSAWTAAGRPMVERSSDSYARWSATVRGILTNAGLLGEFDHADSAQQTLSVDDEGWGEFLTAIRREFGPKEFTARQLVERMTWSAGRPQSQELVDALPAELADQYYRIGPQSITRRLGIWLRNRNGRWAGELVCEATGHNTAANVTRYRVRGPEQE
jgi:hypothetical protein